MAPNQKWVTDITYIRTWEGWLYLATLLDLSSRRIVGGAVADHLDAWRVLEALKMALGRSLPDAGLMQHSDRGCQFTSKDCTAVRRVAGIAGSMSRRGDCWDTTPSPRASSSR